MSVNPATTTRKLVSLPHATLRAVEDYRFSQRIRTESEAIRRLIDRGLDPGNLDAQKQSDAPRLPAPPGPYPWEKLGRDAEEALNIRLPGRLKKQIEWLLSQSANAGQPLTQRGLVTELLQQYAERELRARGIEP